jgi:hypothetical protein
MRMGILMAVALLPGAPQAQAAHTLPPTHTAVLDSLATRLTGELLEGQILPPGRTLEVEQPVPGDTLGLFGQHLLEALRARGASIRVVPLSGSGSAGGADPNATHIPDSLALRLVAKVQSAGVSYIRARRGLLGRPKAYERLGYLHASVSLLDGPARDLLWARTASAERRDFVGRGDLNYVAAGSARLSPVPPGGQGFRLLEPLIVIGVVTGLVVLFYSNRN